jgi:hypothetical protein
MNKKTRNKIRTVIMKLAKGFYRVYSDSPLEAEEKDGVYREVWESNWDSTRIIIEWGKDPDAEEEEEE